MNQMTASRFLPELDSVALRALVKDLGIPPRPSLLLELQQELQREEPRMNRLADIVGSDVALSAALLRSANSPLLGLSRPAETVEQAFMLLGYAHCEAVFIELVLRRALPTDGPTLTRFWDVSAKRARAMAWLARTHRLLPPALAHTCGLFMDVGIPLLAQRFPGPDGYLATLSRANDSLEPFTAIEEAAHQCNHTLVGALTARTWGVSPTVVLAVRLHHEYPGWAGPLPPQVGELVALGLVTDLLIQSYQGKNVHLEWEKGGAAAMARLALSPEALGDWEGALHQLFDLTGV